MFFCSLNRTFASDMIINRKEPKPLMSFIIAYYDLPATLLCECIDSILAISLTPEERQIIIIDDGSDLIPTAALDNYADNILYIRQKHQGLGMARNTGIQVATGDYLQFVDADDQLIKSGYDYCIDIIRSHNDADMVMFDFDEHYDSTANPSDIEVQAVSGTDYMRHHNIHGMACGYLFRSNILGDLRFSPDIFHEDELFTPQLLIRAEILYPTQIKAYYYNKRDSSITTSNDVANTEKRLADILIIIQTLHKLSDRLPKRDKLAMDRRVAQLTMDYIYQVIMQQHSENTLSACIDELKTIGLFPLPNQKYSHKYKLFCTMTNTKLGRTILLKTLPLLKKER